MAQTRRQILVTHNETHNDNSRHRAPPGFAAQRGSPESVPQQRFDCERDRGFESRPLRRRVTVRVLNDVVSFVQAVSVRIPFPPVASASQGFAFPL
jgi:hypothetical protein